MAFPLLPQLQDSRTEIRLLHLQPGQGDEGISVTIGAYDLERAPKYIAISYVWGNGDIEREITANEHPYKVWSNCYDALWQARHHFPGCYVWIDAICVNQNDLDEKSQQVQIMGAIYGRADVVLACVGSDDYDSRLMANMITELVEFGFDLKKLWPARKPSDSDFNMPGEVLKALRSTWMRWSRTQTVGDNERFMDSLLSFARRAYWERLWIVQELTQANAVRICCGRDEIPLPFLKLFQIICPNESLPPGACFRNVVGLACAKFAPANSSIFRENNFKCKDNRDRIYALLSIMDWKDKRYNGHRIRADYHITDIELALTMFRQGFLNGKMRSILRLLHIDSSHPQIRKLIEQRDSAWVVVEGTAGVVMDGTAGVVVDGTSTQPRFQQRMRFHMTRIRENDHGVLVASLNDKPDDVSWDISPRPPDMLTAYHTALQSDGPLSTRIKAAELKKVYLGDNLAAIMCEEARAGDYILDESMSYKLFLIARRREGDLFDIIGQGFYLEPHGVCQPDECACEAQSLSCDVRWDCTFEADLSDEDMMAFYAHDLNWDPAMPRWDGEAHLERLVTRISVRPTPTITLVKNGRDCAWEDMFKSPGARGKGKTQAEREKRRREIEKARAEARAGTMWQY